MRSHARLDETTVGSLLGARKAEMVECEKEKKKEPVHSPTLPKSMSCLELRDDWPRSDYLNLQLK